MMARILLTSAFVIGSTLSQASEEPSVDGGSVYEPAEPIRTYVPMRDGTRIYVEVFRPDDPGKFPAILERSPYDNVYVPPQTRGTEVKKEFVSRGYAYVRAEVRGTGISEGKFAFLGDEAEDGCDVMAWIREQPWCDGNIGTTGLSYQGMNQFAVAALNPPGLKAMFVGVAGVDMYRDCFYPGGVLNIQMFNWALRHIGHIIPPWVPQLRSVPEPVDPEIYPMQLKVHNDRMRLAVQRAFAGKTLYDDDFFQEWLDHPTDGPFWNGISPVSFFDRIQTPVFCYGGWFDYFVEGTIRSFLEIDAPKKLHIGPWFHGQSENEELPGLQIRWFDHWLKGIDNGVMEEPAVKYFVVGADEWKTAESWPPRTKPVRYYLRAGKGEPSHSLNDGALSPSTPESDESPDEIAYDPENPTQSIGLRKVDISQAEKSMLTYTSEPLEIDTAIIGPVEIVLFASTSQKDVDWFARICEVDSEGKSTILTGGVLKGSHCKSHEEPEDLVPGQVYEFAFETPSMCQAIAKGSRIRVSLSNSDFPLFFSNPMGSRNKLCHDPAHLSRIVIPVAE